jgi:hypothetical protein
MGVVFSTMAHTEWTTHTCISEKAVHSLEFCVGPSSIKFTD